MAGSAGLFPVFMGVWIALIALVSLLNYKLIKICESCGRTNRKYFSRRRLCPRCGAVLPG